jgi:NDP-mannose synthase
MDAIALVMAGGRGERMRSSGWPVPKPLVRVEGTPLLEWNLYPIFRAGFTQIVVSVPVDLPAIGDFVRTRASTLALAAGARVEVLEETRPLGNIGCAGLLRDRADTVLVVYADNLTTLDLRAVLRHHGGSDAGLTLSTHVEPFRLPYGEITVEHGRVVEYREKPEHQMLVCSAVSVLGSVALDIAAREAPLGLVDLFHGLVREGEAVAEFRHDAPWVDVNDAAAVHRADALVAARRGAFACWSDPPTRTVTCALITGETGVLVRRVGDRNDRAAWGLPSAVEVDGLSLTERSSRPVLEFDDVEEGTAQVARHQVIHLVAGTGSRAPEGMAWMAPETLAALAEDDALTPSLARAWAVSIGRTRRR